MPDPIPEPPVDVADGGNSEEPAYTRGTVVGLISGAVMFLITRLDRSVDILTDGEIDTLQGLMVLAAPILAASLIRGKVTPTSKVARIVENGISTGVAQQLGVAVTEAVAKKEEDITVFIQAAAEEAEAQRAAEAKPPTKKAAAAKKAAAKKKA